MFFAIFKMLRETMVVTDSGCKLLSKFISPCGATDKAKSDDVFLLLLFVAFSSEYSPNNTCTREIPNYLSVSVC